MTTSLGITRNDSLLAKVFYHYPKIIVFIFQVELQWFTQLYGH